MKYSKEELQQIANEYVERTIKHINRVNKFGKYINKYYTNHDKDKIKDYDLFVPYMFFQYSVKHKDFDVPQEIQDKIDKATALHILKNKHHPEYWANNKKDILKTFKRDVPVMNIDCTKMDNDSIDEMCCDWCAMSEEYNNTPQSWADKVIGDRWLFDDKQKEYIYKMLDKLWSKYEQQRNNIKY